MNPSCFYVLYARDDATYAKYCASMHSYDEAQALALERECKVQIPLWTHQTHGAAGWLLQLTAPDLAAIE
jgi:hypothetical protein